MCGRTNARLRRAGGGCDRSSAWTPARRARGSPRIGEDPRGADDPGRARRARRGRGPGLGGRRAGGSRRPQDLAKALAPRSTRGEVPGRLRASGDRDRRAIAGRGTCGLTAGPMARDPTAARASACRRRAPRLRGGDAPGTLVDGASSPPGGRASAPSRRQNRISSCSWKHRSRWSEHASRLARPGIAARSDSPKSRWRTSCGEGRSCWRG